MTELTDIERMLLDDLETIGERARDERFCAELYRALTENVLYNERAPDQRLSVSWERAEWLVNQWRRRHGEGPLDLDHTGREGEISDTVRDELGRLGWSAEPLDTGRHDPSHLTLGTSPPPPDLGKRKAPTPPPDEDLRIAHEKAHAERERRAW